MDVPGSGYTASHPDFHLPDMVEVGVDFDADKYIKTVREAEVDVIYFFAKCHYGNSYHYTNVGHRHPGLKCDLLAEIVKVCRREDKKIIAYVSGGVDTYAAKHHPDWIPVNKYEDSGEYRTSAVNGGPAAAAKLAGDANVLVNVCLFGPYTDQWLIPQMAEVAEKYDVDGIMTDTMCNFLCYCPHCRERFLNDTGKSLPPEAKGENWLEFCQWRFAQKEEFVDKVCRGVHRAKPDLPVAFNWVYSYRDPMPVNKGIGYLLGDIPLADEQLGLLSKTARYFVSTGLPFEVMTGRFMHGLGEWSIKPVDMMKQGMVTVAANGGRCTLIDRQMPDGSLYERYYRRLKDVFEFIHERRDVFRGSRIKKQIGILHSSTSTFGPNKEFFSPALRRDKAMDGAFMAVTDIGGHSTITNEFNLEKDLAEYETVILPEQYALSDETIELITGYVRNGGTVIASHRTGFREDKWLLSELFGAEYDGEYPGDFNYIMTPSGPDEYADTPFMLHGAAARLRVRTGAVLAHLHEPLTRERFGWGKAPERSEPSSAGVILNRYGQGKAVYVAGPVFQSFKEHYHPAVLYLLRQMLKALVPEPLLEVQSDSLIEVVLAEQARRINIHLINRDGERKFGVFSVTRIIRPTGDIEISFRSDRKPTAVVRTPELEDLPFSHDGRFVRCRISGVRVHNCVQIRFDR